MDLTKFIARSFAAILLLLALALALRADDWVLRKQTGVPIPDGLQFYKHERVSQRLSIVNSTNVNAIYGADVDLPDLFKGGRMRNTNKKPIWAANGGLFWSPRSEWRAVTAVSLPGPVTVTREWTQVLNSFNSYQANTVIRWSFPEGTYFEDLLIRRHDGREWPFELRTKTKRNGQWEYVTYRPWATADELPIGTKETTATTPALDEKIPSKRLTVHLLPHGARPATAVLKPSLLPVTARDGDYLPTNYVGHVVACASCHNRAGESGSYAGVAAPGADSTISWHPFSLRTLNSDDPPILSRAWSINNRAGLREE